MILIEKKYSKGPVQKEVTPAEWERLQALPNCWGWKEVTSEKSEPTEPPQEEPEQPKHSSGRKRK